MRQTLHEAKLKKKNKNKNKEKEIKKENKNEAKLPQSSSRDFSLLVHLLMFAESFKPGDALTK